MADYIYQHGNYDLVKYRATGMVRPGTVMQEPSAFMLNTLHWLCPFYIWTLRERGFRANDIRAGSHRATC